MSPKELELLCVQPEMCLRDALLRMDLAGRGILLMIDKDGILVRTLTDGDLRRAILKGFVDASLLGALPVSRPITVNEAADAADVLRVMDAHQIDHLPVLDTDVKPVDVIFRRELSQRIWLSSPHLGDEETAFVDEAFKSNWIAPMGPHVNAFETELASHVGVGHAAAVSSGTAAIHLGLLLLGVKSGDTVFWCPACFH